MRPDARIKRFVPMPNTIETLQKRVEAAALALYFEEVRRCRDMINAIRGGAAAAEAEAVKADYEGLERQQPGAMGLGTRQERVKPPAGWRAPPKSDPMTSGRSRRGSGKP